MKKAIVLLTICLLACVVDRAQQVQPVPNTDIKGFYIGMAFDAWRTSPVFGGNGEVCDHKEKEIPKHLRQWCKTYEAAKNGGQSGISVPPFTFRFNHAQVWEVELSFSSFDEAKALLVAKFGEPTNSRIGGDITSFSFGASTTGRMLTWGRPDGSFITAHEVIVANSLGTSSTTYVTLLSNETAKILYPVKGYHPDSL